MSTKTKHKSKQKCNQTNNSKSSTFNPTQQNDERNPNEGIDESLKIWIHQRVNEFLQSFEECIEFSSSLTKSQRAYIHEYVKKLGLLSKSRGKGNNRHLALYKRANKSKRAQWLCLTPDSRKFLNQYFLREGSSFQADAIVNEPNIKLQRNSNKDDLLRLNTNFCIPPRSNEPIDLMMERKMLPIYQYRTEILEAIRQHQVIIISGDTGSGKTTQVPQYILENSFNCHRSCRIICTQPRRMATVTISERVAKERGEKLGNTVGFQIRLERCYSKLTNLIYTTSGCLLRSLMTNVKETFRGITHIIIDETHERDKNTDFILINLRDQLLSNKNLKIILMSATMDIDLLSNYFGGCKIITVPGRCYETKIYYLEEILYCTEYKTKRMVEYMNQMSLMEAISSKNDDILAGPSSATSCQKTSLENDNENTNETCIDSETQKHIDSVIEHCCSNLIDNDENFTQLFYLIESENIPIDVKHSKTKKTPLIVAAQVNNYEYVEKFLHLKADISLQDHHGMTAVKYSEIYPDKRCYSLLHAAMIKTQQDSEEPSRMNEKMKVNRILNAYQKQFNDDEEVDHNLLTTLIKMISSSQHFGSILVFLPGYNDIIMQKDLLIDQLPSSTFKLFLLHGNMKIEDQQKVHEPCAVRKIILSTNIGETSITFPDVVFVIDCGKQKMNTYDSITGTSCLKSIWISQACAQQRAGRAGRTHTGICYRMYSRYKFETLDKFAVPEFLRIPLTEICLYAKAVNNNVSITSYLSNALNPPSDICISNAVNKLKIIGALDDDENITSLGSNLVDIPLEVQLGKCLLMAVWMKCLDPILTVVAFHSVKDPFVLPSEKDERGKASSRRKLFSGDSFSDHMGIINLYQQWQNSKRNRTERKFCAENYLTRSLLEMMSACRHQIMDHIRRKYYIDPNARNLNKNSNDWPIIQACLVAGLYPNICFVDRDKTKIISRLENSIAIHPSSVLKPAGYRELRQYIDQFKYEWITFFEKTRSNRVGNIRYNTLIPPIIVALFCGPLPFKVPSSEQNGLTTESNENEEVIECKENHELLTIDDWIEFCICHDDKQKLQRLKMKINDLFLKFLKDETLINNNHLYSVDCDELISTIKQLLKYEIGLSEDPFNSYITNIGRGVMSNIGYFTVLD